MIRDRVFFLAAGHSAHPDGTELKPRRWFVTQGMRRAKRVHCFRAGVAASGVLLLPATSRMHGDVWDAATAVRPTPDVRICTKCFRMAPYHIKGCPRYTEAVGDGWQAPADATVRLHPVAQKVADWLYETGDREPYVAPWIGVRPTIRWYCRLFYRLRKAVRKL